MTTPNSPSDVCALCGKPKEEHYKGCYGSYFCTGFDNNDENYNKFIPQQKQGCGEVMDDVIPCGSFNPLTQKIELCPSCQKLDKLKCETCGEEMEWNKVHKCQKLDDDSQTERGSRSSDKGAVHPNSKSDEPPAQTPTISSLIEKTKKGCGNKFFVKRFGNLYIMTKEDEEYKTAKKTLLRCGDNFSLALCPTCQAKLQAYEECADILKNKKFGYKCLNGCDLRFERIKREILGETNGK